MIFYTFVNIFKVNWTLTSKCYKIWLLVDFTTIKDKKQNYVVWLDQTRFELLNFFYKLESKAYVEEYLLGFVKAPSQFFAILEFYFAFKNCMRVHTLSNIYTHVQTQGVKGYLSNYMVFYYACPPWSKTPRADIYLANRYLLLSRGKTRTYIHIWRNSLQTIYITSIMT